VRRGNPSKKDPRKKAIRLGGLSKEKKRRGGTRENLLKGVRDLFNASRWGGEADIGKGMDLILYGQKEKRSKL